MTPLPPEHRQRQGTALARRRDALLLWLLLRHPATAGMLAEVGLFPTRKKASRRLLRLLRRKQVRLLGTVNRQEEGRPEHVYGRGRCKADNLLHEVELTRLLLKIHADEVRRGPGEVDPVIRPDAELVIRGERYFVEMDLGSIPYDVMMAKRFARYRSTRDLVLWVCPTVTRMEGLRTRAGTIRETALFTTLDSALRDPHGAVWVDADGGRAALPRGGRCGAIRGDKGGAEGGANGGPLSLPASGVATTPAREDAPTGGQDAPGGRLVPPRTVGEERWRPASRTAAPARRPTSTAGSAE